MMSRHFALSSELTGAIAKILPHAKNQLSAPGSFCNQIVTDIYIYILYTNLRICEIQICEIIQICDTNLRNQQLCIIVANYA